MASRKRPCTPSRYGGKRVDNKEQVEVVCRLCPYSGIDSCVIPVDDEHVKVVAPPNLKNGQMQETLYKLGYVFDENDSQRVVFERTALDLIENLVRGRNSLLFTYGVTGSGKTYTMTGDTKEESIGILPRTLDVIFNSLINRVDKCVFAPDGRNGYIVRSEFESALARRRLEVDRGDASVEFANRYIEHRRVSGTNPDYAYAVFVSYVEVYNDVCYDLLDDPVIRPDGTRALASKDVRLGANNKVYVHGLVEVEVESSDEALEQFYRGQERRRVGDTLLNKQSSRSHSIYNIRVVMAPYELNSCYPETDANKVVVSQLSLVDLAGSERTKRTGNEGVRLVETGKINTSLMVLRQCFKSLREKQRRGSQDLQTIPYRDSKLTRIFQNYFEGNGKIRMIICVNPSPYDYSENLGVLEFAELSQDVKVQKAVDPLPQAMGDFPVPRRQFTKWLAEVESLVTNSVNNNLRPCPPFDKIYSVNVDALSQLRSFYTSEIPARNQVQELYEQKSSDFEMQVKRTLCMNDMQQVRIRLLEEERDEAERLLSTVTAQLKQARRENVALRQRNARYEAEESDKANQEEERRKRERLYQNQLWKKAKMIDQVREIVEKPYSTVSGALKNIENSEKRALCHDEKEMKNECPSPHRVALARQQWEARSVANQNQRTGFYNPRYHRRSKSANCRMIDHQPRTRIPEGTIMQPKLPRHASRPTKKINVGDLKKSSDYLLTHQEVDSDGNLMTQIVKGECIPTAGGGTAVRFNDVERLSHDSPSRPQKSSQP